MTAEPHPLSLLLEAERLTHIFRQTVRAHKPTAGQNSYWHYRAYQSGEPATLIDWHQSARLNKLHVRERDVEEPQTLCLWIDRAARLFSIPGYMETAFTLGLALARLRLEDGDKVVWFDALPHTMTGAGGFNAFAMPLLPPRPVEETLPPLNMPPTKSHLVLCSDFPLESLAPLRDRLTLYAGARVRCVFLQLTSNASAPEETVRALAHKAGALYLSHTAETALPDSFAKLVAALESAF